MMVVLRSRGPERSLSFFFRLLILASFLAMSCVSSLLVAVKSASICRSEAVAVARLAKASAVSLTKESMALLAPWYPVVCVVPCEWHQS